MVERKELPCGRKELPHGIKKEVRLIGGGAVVGD